MERRIFSIDDIHVGGRHRSPDMKQVENIARSIGAVGLMNPPAVCMRDGIKMDDGEVCDSVPVLIYGRHRLLALQSIAQNSVECLVYDVDELHAELMEIDENLARSELKGAERDSQTLRREEVWAEINKGGQILATSSTGQKRQFASEVSALTGESKSGVNARLARARELKNDLHRVTGTSLDKGVELDALAKLPQRERQSLIARAEAGEQVSARPFVQPPTPAERKAAQRQKFWTMWAALDDDVREELHAKLRTM